MKRTLKVLTGLLAMALLLSACGNSGKKEQETKEDPKLKVALLLSGPANDQGWNATALEGLKAAQSEYGIETSYMENVTIADSEAAYTDYASQGFDLIVGHGFQFGDPAIKVAQQFTNQAFMATESNSQNKNMASYVMSCEQGGYIMGLLSAGMSKSGKIGVIGGVEQPSIIKEVEAFKIAAKSINPNIEVMDIYINTFTDVATGKEAALSMIDQGADVLYHVANQAGTGVIKACEEKKILACGNSYDQNSIAPDTVIASTVYNMPKVILNAVEKVKNNNFEGGVFYLGMKEEVVEISKYNGFENKIPAELKEKIEEVKKEIIDGTLEIPIIETSSK